MTLKVPARLALALRNVFRHRARSAATLASIAFGVAGLILAGGFVQDIFVQLGEAIIHSQTGHIQVAKQGFREGRNKSPELFAIEKPEELKSVLQGQPGVNAALARLNFSGMLNNGKRDLGIIGEGVEPSGEANLGTYLHFIEGRSLSDSDVDGIIVGQGVARSLGLKVGDRVTLVISLAEGAVNTLDFELIGVFQSFSKEFDARSIRIPLKAARELMDTKAAHVIVLTLDHTPDSVPVAQALRQTLDGRGLEVATWTELSDFYEKTIELYDRQFGVLRLIILLMVLLSVANSVNMTLFERTREFGTMLALGNRPNMVFRLIMVESALLGLLGAGLGMTLGILLSLAISAIGIPMPPPPNANIGYVATIRLVTSDVLTAGSIGFAAAFLATLLPARRASRLFIVDALRQGV